MASSSLADHNLYWMGGSACSGKSSIAARLALRHDLTLFHSDDSMYPHMHAADPARHPVMAKVARLGWNELWMRPLAELLADELAFYREEFELLLAEIAALPPQKPILAEGNAWLPKLLEGLGVSPGQVVYLVPTPEFQVEHYARRGFIQEILSQCADPQAAFRNWMERDAAFGEVVRAQAVERGMQVIRVDGSKSLDEIEKQVETEFNLTTETQRTQRKPKNKPRITRISRI